MCVSVYLYVCSSNFSKVAKLVNAVQAQCDNILNKVAKLVNAVQAQCDNTLNLIVLDFRIKALFSSYA